MIKVEKNQHAFDIQVDEKIITVTYAEWLIIKNQMTELIIKEIL